MASLDNSDAPAPVHGSLKHDPSGIPGFQFSFINDTANIVGSQINESPGAMPSTPPPSSNPELLSPFSFTRQDGKCPHERLV